MASDIFIKIDGIAGESKNKTYKDQIDVLSWSWGVSQGGSMGTGGGGGRGRVSAQDLSFSKDVDKATPKLIEACCKGTHIAKIIISACKAGDKPLEFFKLTLSECLITSVQCSGHEGGFSESVTVNFAKYEMDYTEQDAKGGALGKVASVFSIKENAA